jgi:hypothetical protein
MRFPETMRKHRNSVRLASTSPATAIAADSGGGNRCSNS